MSTDEELLDPLLVSECSIPRGTKPRNRPERRVTPTALAPDRLPSMLDYDVIKGVPVRVIRPRTDRRFVCYTSSYDKQIMATAETPDIIKSSNLTLKTLRCGSRLWRTADYVPVGMATGLHVVDMCFVDKGSATLRVLEKDDVCSVADLQVHRSDRNPVCSVTARDESNLRVIRRSSLHGLREIGWHNFSSDGNTLMIDNPHQSVSVYRFQGHGCHLQCKLSMPPELHRCPVLSPNGCSVFTTCVDPDFVESDLSKARIRVWPTLNFNANDEEQNPELVNGNRAVWVGPGEHLAVWEYNEATPVLKVYRIEDLSFLQPKPIASKVLSPGLSNWKIYGYKYPYDSLIICEIYKSGKRRVMEWDFDYDVVRNELCMTMPTERNVGRGRFVSGDLPPEEFCECELPVKSWQEFVRLAAEDAHPLSCASDVIDGRGWDWCWVIGSFCWKHHSCAVAFSVTGTTIFSCTLPGDIPLSARGMSMGVAFDFAGRHFMVIGERAIFAFSPTILRASFAYQLKTEKIPAEVSWSDIRAKAALRDAFSILGNGPLAHALNWCDGNFFGPQSPLSAQKIAFHQVGLCSSRDWCAWLAFDRYAGLNESPLAGIFDYRKLEDGHQIMPQIIPLPDHFRPMHVFVYPRVGHEDGIVFLSEYPPEILSLDVSTGKMRSSNLNVEICLSVSQTCNRRRLVILERFGVCFLDLATMSIDGRISYRMDFKKVFKQLDWSLPKFPSGKTPRLECRRRVSDDGKTVLLAWDAKTRRSILAAPEIEQQYCEALLDKAGSDLLCVCQLNGDGSCTLFPDTDELLKGRIVVGLFSNTECRIRNRVCLTEGVPAVGMSGQLLKQLLSSIFFELSDDATEIFVLTVPTTELDAQGFELVKEVNKFSIYGTEECIPDYNRFIRSRGTDLEEKIQQMSAMFGCDHVLNYSHSKGMTIFQEAIMQGDREIVDCLLDSATTEGLKVATQWTSEEGMDVMDFLTDGLEHKAIGKVEKAIDFIASDACTLQDASLLSGEAFGTALKTAPRRMEKALMDDEFVVELCQLEVHTDYLDPVLRRDKAVHIGTMDEALPWILEDNPAVLAEKWRSENWEKIKAMEKNGNKSTTTMSLKVIAIKGAAVGSMGLIRHLLLHKAPESVFKSKAVMWIIEHKWYEVWKEKFMLEAGMHFAFLFVLTTYIILIGNEPELSEANIDVKVVSTILLMICMCYGLMSAFGEGRQITTFVDEGRRLYKSVVWGVKYYLSSKWNWVDLVSCLLLLILIPTLHVASLSLTDCDNVLSVFVALEAILAYIKVWYFAQPFRVTGALVLMIENIARDCIAFMFLAFIIMLGFALAFLVMFRTAAERLTKKKMNGNASNDATSDEDTTAAFGTFLHSLRTLFLALFGQFDNDDVREANEDLAWVIDGTFSTYMIVQVIVLLNLLISIMGDTFDRVKSNEKAQFLMARAMIIDSCEASTTENERRRIECNGGTYVYALEPTDESPEVDNRNEWQGRLVRLEESFRAIVQRSEARMRELVKEEIKSMRDEIRQLSQRFVKEDKGVEQGRETEAQRNVGRASPSLIEDVQQHLTARLDEIKAETSRLSAQMEDVMSLLQELRENRTAPAT